MKKITLVLAALALLASSCGGEFDPREPSASEQAQEQAAEQAANNVVYVPQNNVELNNYNARQELADDPTTILWCTATFPQGGLEPITVPVVGKLTSGSKRPYATEEARHGGDSVRTQVFNPEIAGPDGMFGSSVEYRYGFSVTGNYVEFTNIPTVCTDEPMVWQTLQTEVVLSVDSTLNEASDTAQDALRSGDVQGAIDVLTGAINE